ncbi:hypothetical protein ACE14D_05870 [Streptomyces sp. Act-28]
MGLEGPEFVGVAGGPGGSRRSGVRVGVAVVRLARVRVTPAGAVVTTAWPVPAFVAPTVVVVLVAVPVTVVLVVAVPAAVPVTTTVAVAVVVTVPVTVPVSVTTTVAVAVVVTVAVTVTVTVTTTVTVAVAVVVTVPVPITVSVTTTVVIVVVQCPADRVPEAAFEVAGPIQRVVHEVLRGAHDTAQCVTERGTRMATGHGTTFREGVGVMRQGVIHTMDKPLKCGAPEK